MIKDNYIKMLVEESGDFVEKAVKFPELLSEILKQILRHDTNVECDGSEDQRIDYSTPMTESIRPLIDDYDGLGIQVEAYDENGFTITSLSAGHFGYLTIKKL